MPSENEDGLLEYLHLSPGRSFQAAQSRIYELVPYLKNDGNRHDFSHTINHLYFTADDEVDESKAQNSREMRERLGIYQNPLDGNEARVRRSFFALSLSQRGRGVSVVDVKCAIHVPLLPQGRIDAISPWTVKSSTRTNTVSRTLSATS